MAYKNLFLILAIVVLPTIVIAKDYIVGDYTGWTTGFDYIAWAKGKEFFVGDRLIFKYQVGRHNVFKVNGTAFQNCAKPPLSEALVSGYDVITLATSGRKWYICGVAMHCAMGGQKLFIEVSEYGILTPGAAPYPAKEKITAPAEDISAPAPSMVYGKDYIVGDYMGWTTGFNYQAWAKGKKFFVGDRLIFKYSVGHHNVFKVNGTAFQTCAKPPLSEALTSGYDVITLATPGRKWYICGVAMHCAMGGQKLFIEVSEYGVLTPGAAPYPAQGKAETPDEVKPTSPAPSPVSGC